VLVDDLDRRRTRRKQAQGVVLEPLHLDPESLAVGDDESEIADLRAVHPRIVDFVHDPEADGEPDARSAERTAHHVLGAAGPGWGDARVPGRMSVGPLQAHGSAIIHPATPAALPSFNRLTSGFWVAGAIRRRVLVSRWSKAGVWPRSARSVRVT